ncbi:c-type cytochrome [Mariprofundus ferrooxydans]|uniref:c-type cytochrome n=1 Tax=Mariprofundus ferrooxydans TaxID=314344 RepID=UPI00036EED85|nr:c-type cytochrome [Mariprofundus ferrooxydans]
MFVIRIRKSTILLAFISVVVSAPFTGYAESLNQAVESGKHLFMTANFNGNSRTCNSCHMAGGTTAGKLPDGSPIPSLNNAAAVFPRYNRRQEKVITLLDQVHNCVAGALQGTPPAYDSAEMVDLISYLSSLSQGKPLNMGGKPE